MARIHIICIKFCILCALQLVSCKSKKDILIICLTCINFNDLEEFKSVIDDYNDLDQFRDENGLTFLHHAAGAGRYKFVDYLLSKGCDINAEAKNGNTPLNEALGNHDSDMAKYLIEKGADVFHKNHFHDNVIHDAVMFQDEELINYFLCKGVDHNEYDISGHTPLQKAIIYKQMKAIISLIRDGSDIERKTEDGKSIMDLAKESGIEKQLKEIIQEKNFD